MVAVLNWYAIGSSNLSSDWYTIDIFIPDISWSSGKVWLGGYFYGIFIYSGDDTWEPLMGKVATGYMCDLSDQMPF